MTNRWNALYLLVLVLTVSMLAVAFFWDPVCQDLYELRATKFDVVGIYQGHGEGRIEKGFDWNEKCFDSKFLVDGQVYSTSGQWRGDLPEAGNRVRIVSPTGWAKDVVITDLTTGKSYLSGYKPLVTPQP